MEEVEALKKKLWEIEEKLILKWLTVKDLLQQIKDLEKEHDRLSQRLEQLLCDLYEKEEAGGKK